MKIWFSWLSFEFIMERQSFSQRVQAQDWFLKTSQVRDGGFIRQAHIWFDFKT